MIERYQMVFVFDRSGWMLRDKVAVGEIFRLGPNLYVPTAVSGEMVIARPFHDMFCRGPHEYEWIPIEAYREAMRTVEVDDHYTDEDGLTHTRKLKVRLDD